MGMVIAVIIGLMFAWGIFEFPGFFIPFIIIIVVVGACVGIKEKEETEITETAITETTVEASATEDSIREQCIDGILYLLIRQDGQNFMAPKENRYGDNKRCQTP